MAERSTVDFDHHHPVDVVDPQVAFAQLRGTCPVAWSANHGGYWVFTRYTDVVSALKDYRTFSSVDGNAIPAYERARAGVSPPIHLDPPEAQKYRRVLNPFLTQSAVAELAPRVEYWTDHFIDEIVEHGSADFVADLASPVPSAVTLEWMGWSRMDEARRISQAWHDLFAYPRDDPHAQHAAQELAWFESRITEELAERRRSPREDVITHIATLEVDGARVSDEYAQKMVALLIAGGVDTTTSLIASALVHLHRHPEQRQRLIEDPGLWDTATSEFLRRFPSVWTVARTVTQDTSVGGCLLHAGDRVLVGAGSACHDEDMFSDADQVVLDRSPNPHVAFGFGVHRCIGKHLAEAEFAAVMKHVLERMPDYRVLEDGAAPYAVQTQLSGWIRVPVTFTPGSRRLGSDTTCCERSRV